MLLQTLENPNLEP